MTTRKCIKSLLHIFTVKQTASYILCSHEYYNFHFQNFVTQFTLIVLSEYVVYAVMNKEELFPFKF